jgi:hypothetical protein
MTAVCLVKNETLYMMSVYVSVTIVAFYFIGHFVRFYIVSKIFPKPIEDDAEDTDGLNRMDDPVFTDTYETEEIS